MVTARSKPSSIYHARANLEAGEDLFRRNQNGEKAEIES